MPRTDIEFRQSRGVQTRSRQEIFPPLVFDIIAPSANPICQEYKLTQYPEAWLLRILEETVE